jgi:hypothetical protein
MLVQRNINVGALGFTEATPLNNFLFGTHEYQPWEISGSGQAIRLHFRRLMIKASELT